jgi:signal transduction histidine kinase
MQMKHVNMQRQPHGSPRSGGPAAGRARVTGVRYLGLVAAALAAMAPVAVLVGLTMTTKDPTSRPVLVATLVQLAVIVVAVLIYVRRNDLQLDGLRAFVELGSRAEVAEAALSREQERLHELRATIVGLTLSHRVLHDRRSELTDEMASRLERLQETEMGRLERLLADQPNEPGQAVDLAQVVDPLLASLELRGHRVHWAGTRCQAFGRADDIAEIVQGLLENAVLHAGGSGVDLQVVPRGDWIDLRVSDRGPGVDPAVIPRLFERGARGPGSPGHGIGLHVARRLTLEMGGQLALDRSPGHVGATFVLTLPSLVGAAPCLAHSG